MLQIESRKLRFLEEVLCFIKNDNPSLYDRLQGVSGELSFDSLLNTVCRHCESGNNEECRSCLRILALMKTDSRVHGVQLSNSQLDQVAKVLQNITRITNSGTLWNFELLDALDAYRTERTHLVLYLVRDLLEQFQGPRETVVTLELLAKFNASGIIARQQAENKLACESSEVVYAALHVVQTWAEESKVFLGSLIGIATSESAYGRNTILANQISQLKLDLFDINSLDIRDEQLDLLIERQILLGEKAKPVRTLLESVRHCQARLREAQSNDCARFHRWTDFGIGLLMENDNRIRYLVFSPCPQNGDRLLIEQGQELKLPNSKRFKSLFSAFASSATGNRANESCLIEVSTQTPRQTVADLNRIISKKIEVSTNENAFNRDESEIECSFAVRFLRPSSSKRYEFGGPVT